MNVIDKLKNTIKGRTVGLIARGKSIENLEGMIGYFRDKDICWASMNLIAPAEILLNKIDKKLDFISDCSNATLRDTFEPEVRRPRFENYLSKGNNLLMISNTVIDDFKITKQDDLLDKYKESIVTIDEIFSEPTCPKDVWDAPPNSITLLLAALIAGQAKKIIIFGLDGYRGNKEFAIDTYYRADLEKEDRIKAGGQVTIGSLGPDSADFERRWKGIFEMYKKAFCNPDVKIINCSSDSIFTVFPKINYGQLADFIK